MTYTDAEVDAVALAMVNAQRKFLFNPPLLRLAECDGRIAGGAELVRECARAALAARDALLETVGERWEARGDSGFSRRCASRDAAHRERTQLALLGHESARVVHVTTKRRKR